MLVVWCNWKITGFGVNRNPNAYLTCNACLILQSQSSHLTILSPEASLKMALIKPVIPTSQGCWENQLKSTMVDTWDVLQRSLGRLLEGGI